MVKGKPVGWRKEPGRHALAAKGIKTGGKQAERRMLVKRLLRENAADLKVGTKIMMDAKQMMLDGHYRLGKKQLKGAEAIWDAKGQLLFKQGEELGSPKLMVAGGKHIQAAHSMTKQILAEVNKERKK